MSLAKARKLLDKLSLELQMLGTVSSNGVVPDYKSLRTAWSLPPGKFHYDNTTGFDEPYERLAINCRRHRCGDNVDIMHDRTKADHVMEVSVMDGSTGSRDVKWIDDHYYPAWASYGLASWKQERGLDVRHLTNEEFEAFKTIVDRTLTSVSNFNTWCSVHYRCTIEQVKYYVDRKAVQTQPWPFFIDYNHGSSSKISDYIAYADPAMVLAAARVFPLLTKFKL